MKLNQKLRLANNQYNPLAQKKDTIVLHHTAGFSAESCIRWWNQTPENVGVAYVIERDGTIYEAFDPKTWAYHLGANKLSLEKSSIGIELVSPGPLVLRGDTYYLGTSNVKLPKDYYKGPLNFEFRGYKFYVPYTAEQIDSLKELLLSLQSKFSIPIQKDETHYDSLCEFQPNYLKDNITGLWAHTSFRKDKTDVFPDLALIRMLKDTFAVKTFSDSIPSRMRVRKGK